MDGIINSSEELFINNEEEILRNIINPENRQSEIETYEPSIKLAKKKKDPDEDDFDDDEEDDFDDEDDDFDEETEDDEFKDEDELDKDPTEEEDFYEEDFDFDEDEEEDLDDESF